jgi:LysM repeat protein
LKKVMSATNPFRVPSCFQVDHERRRRERFKRTFIAVVAAGILALMGLLIEGCVTEHAKAAVSTGAAAGLPEPSSNPSAVAAEPEPVLVPQPNPQPAMSQSVLAVSKVNTAPAGQVETIHVVKSGDTLARIARVHGTTVKAIEAANGLAGDHIAVGTKLKLPEI